MNDNDAASIYAEYPRKIGKLDAYKAMRQAVKLLRKDKRFAGADLSCVVEFLRQRVAAYAAAMEGQDKQFIPYCATWMRRGSYDDDPAEWGPSDKPVTQLSKLLEDWK